jgi:hypothetical protein
LNLKAFKVPSSFKNHQMDQYSGPGTDDDGF